MGLFHLGRLEEAEEAFTKTIDVDSEYVIAWYHMGIIAERKHDVDGAVVCFERVVDANPHDASAHYHLGLQYERQGLDSLAITALSKALDLDPSDSASRQALQELQR